MRIQRIRSSRRQRISNRIHRRRTQLNMPQPNKPFNNEETLRSIENLPPQQITNNSLADQFFNGIPF